MPSIQRSICMSMDGWMVGFQIQNIHPYEILNLASDFNKTGKGFKGVCVI